jgi:hypothetical protein
MRASRLPGRGPIGYLWAPCRTETREFPCAWSTAPSDRTHSSVNSNAARTAIGRRSRRRHAGGTETRALSGAADDIADGSRRYACLPFPAVARAAPAQCERRSRARRSRSSASGVSRRTGRGGWVDGATLRRRVAARSSDRSGAARTRRDAGAAAPGRCAQRHCKRPRDAGRTARRYSHRTHSTGVRACRRRPRAARAARRRGESGARLRRCIARGV